MNEDRVTDRLAAPADELNQRGAARTDPALGVEDATLLNVAARARHALQPVSPTPAFRAHLREGLEMAAHHQQAHRWLIAERNPPPWGWLIGAAALGSAAGVIAVVLRSRAQTHKPAAQPQMQR